MSKGFAASFMVALKRLLTGVRALVDDQRATLSQSLATAFVVALKRLFSSVGFGMACKPVGKRLSTVWAFQSNLLLLLLLRLGLEACCPRVALRVARFHSHARSCLRPYARSADA